MHESGCIHRNTIGKFLNAGKFIEKRNYSPHIQPSIIPRNFKGHLSGILFHSILITMVLDGRIAH